MKNELSEEEVKFIKKMAKKYGYKYSKAKRLFLKGDLEETITTTSSGVSPGGSGEFKGRFGSGTIKRQYNADEKQREKALKTGFGAVKYLRQKLK
jgi:hypothetical protein